MNYREHLTLNTALLAPTAYIVADRDVPQETVALFLLGYVIGTFWLSPDLDIHSQPYKNWSIFKFVWRPYQLFPHRSIFTHAPIFGTAGRVIYVHVAAILPLCGALLAFEYFGIGEIQSSTGAILERYMSTIISHPQSVIGLLVGLELSAIGHLIGDILGSIRTKLKARGRMRGKHQFYTANKGVSGISI